MSTNSITGPVIKIDRARPLTPGLLLLVLALPGPAAAANDLQLRVVNGMTTVHRHPLAGVDRGGGVATLANGNFDDGLASWSTSQSGGNTDPGAVATESGKAMLREGDSFLVTLSQEFQLPANAASISFAVELEPGFDTSVVSIPDAFEISLLDINSRPVTSSWSDQATSFLNFQESGAINLGAGVIWDGQRATLDLGGLAAGSVLTLHFDLIGADADVASAVRLDDVEVTVSRPEEGFIRGNPNLDGAVNITDPIVILNYLFLGTSTLDCLDAADTNNDGLLNITDPIYLLGYLFLGTEPIPPPYPSCGLDEGPADALDCNPCSCPSTTQGGDCP